MITDNIDHDMFTCTYFSSLHQVNLYSDPPKPGHSVQSGLNQQASRIMTMDFRQAQRAEINSASLHPNGHSAQQSTLILFNIYRFFIYFI